jgi:hypothetical protein
LPATGGADVRYTLTLLAAAAALAACGLGKSRVEDQVLEAVKAAVGDVTEFKFTRVAWCPNKDDNGNRAAFVAAVGNTTLGNTAGMGGYFVEVMADGTVGPAHKADGVNSPSYDALRIDRTYCDSKIVVGPYRAMQHLDDMRQGRFAP